MKLIYLLAMSREISHKPIPPHKPSKRPQPPKTPSPPPSNSPWGKLVRFCNDSYERLIPRSEENQANQAPRASIHNHCVTILIQQSHQSWDNLVVQNFSGIDRRIAGDFFYFISNKRQDSPQDTLEKFQSIVRKFSYLIAYVLEDDREEDLVKLGEFVDLIDVFNKSSEKTFLFLSLLPKCLKDKEAKKDLQQSKSYQQLLDWGASEYLKGFGFEFLKYFNMTRTAIQEKTSQNLARELAEIEKKFQREIKELETKNQELQENIETLRAQGFEKAVIQLAQTLQNQSQPVLDQASRLYQRLKLLEQSEAGLSLSNRDSLSVLIVLENLLGSLGAINLEQFPLNYQEFFTITSNQLGEYEYVNGSQFQDANDVKTVRCVYPGWRVGQTIITPARVEEISAEQGE